MQINADGPRSAPFHKSLKVRFLLFIHKKQEKSDLFFQNILSKFALVEVSLFIITA